MIVNLLIALLAAAVVCIVLLVLYIVTIERERRALLDRLLVANQIMPITPAPSSGPPKEARPAQRIKFKLFP